MIITLRKQLFSILLFLLYLVALVKPLIPTLIYYTNYDYIVTELCENKDKPEMECHGKCYLKKLQDSFEPIKHNDKPISKEFLLLKEYPVITLDFESYGSVILDIYRRLTKPNFSKHFVISEYSISIFHPPKTFL